MAVPPRDPWYGRYRGYAGRPYAGCAWLYLLLFILFLGWLFWWLILPWFWVA